MEYLRLPIVCVHSAVRHLGQLPAEGGGVGGGDLLAIQIQHQILLQPVVLPLLPTVHIHHDLRQHLLRHLEEVGAFHGDCDVRNPAVDFFLSERERLIGINHKTVGLVRAEELLTVAGDEAAQAHTLVQQLVFGKQIHQSIAGGRSGQPNDPTHFRPHFHQSLESLGL